MLVVKFDIASLLSIPINGRLFGANKTLRGLLFLTITTALTFGLINTKQVTPELSNYIFGALLGLTYILMELPNSFIKRRLGIKAGQSSEKYKLISILMDKSDSTFGVTVVYSFLLGLGPIVGFKIFGIAFALHLGISYLLVLLKIKRSL
jgi:CDP-diacylglycerol--serine O-phosphatidyltransferase